MSRAGAGRGPVLVAPDAGALARLAADRIARALARAAAGAPDPSVDLLVALAGGRTPRAAYGRLACDRSVPWGRLRVLPGDERAVRPDHPEANVALLAATLVVPGALDGARLVRPIPADAPLDAEGLVTPGALDAAARAFAAALTGPAGDRPLDLLLLGLGEDGHVASLFPRSATLAVQAPVAVERHAPKPPPRRLTLAPPALRAARQVFVLAGGTAKAAAVAAALEGTGPADDCPARLVRGATWLLDREAAARLRGPVTPVG